MNKKKWQLNFYTKIKKKCFLIICLFALFYKENEWDRKKTKQYCELFANFCNEFFFLHIHSKIAFKHVNVNADIKKNILCGSETVGDESRERLKKKVESCFQTKQRKYGNAYIFFLTSKKKKKN